MTLDLPALLDVLSRNDVRFVVIGGFAVGVHGHVRMTADLDLVPDPDPPNVDRLIAALTQIDARVPSGEPFDPAAHGPALRQGANATLATNVGGVDIVQRLAGVPGYAALEASAIEASLDDVTVRVCSLADLRAMKASAGRPVDLADLASLPEA